MEELQEDLQRKRIEAWLQIPWLKMHGVFLQCGGLGPAVSAHSGNLPSHASRYVRLILAMAAPMI